MRGASEQKTWCGVNETRGIEFRVSRPPGPEALVSIVAAFFNEEDTIAAFFQALEEIAQALDCALELICVNDGSRDRTLMLLRQQMGVSKSSIWRAISARKRPYPLVLRTPEAMPWSSSTPTFRTRLLLSPIFWRSGEKDTM
jgi:hypothetical protein